MAGDVGERLLSDAVCRHLDGGGERRQLVRRIYDDVQPIALPRSIAVAEHILGCLLANVSYQPQLVEGWRTQIVDQTANVANRRLNILAQLGQQRVGGA